MGTTGIEGGIETMRAQIIANLLWQLVQAEPAMSRANM